MLNTSLVQELELFGLTNDHLSQLLAVCQRGAGRATWHVAQGVLTKVEVTLVASRPDTSSMRELTHLLQRKRG